MKNYKHPKYISTLFSSIANNYDLLNNLMTFGIHKHWNKQLIKLLAPQINLLDLCAGTGDISFIFLKKSSNNQAILVDISELMLKKAQKKVFLLPNKVNFIKSDVHTLPFKNQSISFITMAYGLRNLFDPETCLNEIFRVLKSKGKVGILELTQPQNKKLKTLHQWHFKFYIKLLSKIFSNNQEAYNYLENSIYHFLSSQELIKLYEKNFNVLKTKQFLKGIATIWILEKP